MTPGTTVEREWKDQFGHHIEVTATGVDGRIYSQKITRSLFGWPGLEAARAAVARAAVAQAALKGDRSIMTPERQDIIRACWTRVCRQALEHMRATHNPVFRAVAKLKPLDFSSLSGAINEEAATFETLTFVHEKEHAPGTGWRVVCEGLIVEHRDYRS